MNDALDRVQAVLPERYKLEKELHRSGLATFYRARDLEHAHPVTIKVVGPHIEGTAGKRFVRECGFLAKLEHPLIAKVLDVGVSAGFCYLVTPYLDGETLRERLDREGQIPIDAAVKIVCDVADALCYAHENYVIYRDVKPERVTLVAGNAIISDFGLYYAAEDFGDEGPAVYFKGTPCYASPEHITGGELVGAGSDVYSLGVLLYEMLAGKFPFEGVSVAAMMKRILIETPPSLRVVRPEVPEQLANVVEVAMAKKLDQRFQTMAEFRAALAGSLDESGRPPRKAWWRLPWL
ncbi:serine/threonine protein kinase [Gemmatimonadota bacterium]